MSSFDNRARWAKRAVWAIVGAAALTLSGYSDEPARPKVKVKVTDDNPVVVEAELPVDPADRIRLLNQNQQGFYLQIQDEQGRQLHLSHFGSFQIDGQFVSPINMPIQFQNVPPPKLPGGKQFTGIIRAFTHGDLRITQRAEIVPTKAPPGQKRRRDAVMVRYTIENKGATPHKVGVRNYIDAYIIDNDGAMFAAPTIPDKVLDGMELKDKTLPDYLQVLQRPDLKNPGFVAHATLNLGSGWEKPNKVVLTRHGIGFNTWEMQAVQSMGDSAFGIFWDPKEIKPGAKREVAYAYGQGIATSPNSDGPFQVVLGGSFEPGKTFTITALIADPAQGQSLALELPRGMERVEGAEIQPVPISDDSTLSVVLWKARVLETGSFPVRIRSSTGVTQTKNITITAE